MLLIGDIHANARHINAILENMKKFTEEFSDEKNIVFMGDYMYMFSYDRQALGDLFDFFLELRGQGKNVYILTGNHDWLNQHFVYHEGKKVADILIHNSKFKIQNENHNNKIYFITEPEVHTIEDKEILFMPYNKGFLGNYLNKCHAEAQPKNPEFNTLFGQTSNTLDPSLRSEGQQLGTVNYELGILNSELNIKDTIKVETLPLLTSSNYNEQLSGALNHYLLEHYKPGMVLIHHYYTADISFPGQQAKFDYKDISLHPGWTTYADKVISGHLHKAFIHENYLCVGSVWSTTSGERNQCKFLWKRDIQNDTIDAREIAINPYVSVESAGNLTIETIQQKISTIHNEHTHLLPETTIHPTSYDLEKTSLILYTPDSVQNIESILDPEVKAKIGDIQLKQISSTHKDMTELLDITQYNIKESLLDWKELVKKYLMSRYGPESEKYRTLLSELNIL